MDLKIYIYIELARPSHVCEEVSGVIQIAASAETAARTAVRARRRMQTEG